MEIKTGLKTYIDSFLIRYDKDGILPYISSEDYVGLNKSEDKFVDRNGNTVAYFYYRYPTVDKDSLILFLPGMGPGHTSYMREIETLCRKGYGVLTLDYTGTGDSTGAVMPSLNQPTMDAIALLDHVGTTQNVIAVGHSLGGYAVLNILNMREDVRKGVSISGFLEVDTAMEGEVFDDSRDDIRRMEDEFFAGQRKTDNKTFLKQTDKDVLLIQSPDDMVISYRNNLGWIMSNVARNNVVTLSVDGKKHNPNYTDESLEYLTEVFTKLSEINGVEEKKNYMKDKSAFLMTEQDKGVWDKIFRFLEK